MSLVGLLKLTFARAKVMQKASRQLLTHDDDGAVETIYSCLNSNESLKSVVALFCITRGEVKLVLGQLLTFTDEELHAGHFIAVEAMVCQDTLCYLMRAERYQIPKHEAYAAVRDFCKANGRVFKPEYAYRAKHGL